MKTKPFNMEAALNGAPVVTRDGRRVRDIQYSPYPINATIENSDGTDLSTNFTLEGHFFGKSVSCRDLLILDEEGGEE